MTDTELSNFSAQSTFQLINNVAPTLAFGNRGDSSEKIKICVHIFIFSCVAPIVQWIKQLRPKEKLYVRIVVGAPHSFERFQQAGSAVTQSEQLTKDAITTMLGQQVGRLFRLLGWVDESLPEVTLRIHEVTATRLRLESQEPPFGGLYSIATEPPPAVTTHGDYLFDLMLEDGHV